MRHRWRRYDLDWNGLAPERLEVSFVKFDGTEVIDGDGMSAGIHSIKWARLNGIKINSLSRIGRVVRSRGNSFGDGVHAFFGSNGVEIDSLHGVEGDDCGRIDCAAINSVKGDGIGGIKV